MKKRLTLCLFALISGIVIAPLSHAGDSKLIEGDVLKSEGEFYTVHDTAGHEVRVHVDKTTHLEAGAFKVGDKVEAHVTEKGHVRSMIHLAASGTMARPGSKIVEGDVLNTEGEYYIVRDRSGHDVRLHVDKTTHLEGGAFRVGDKLQAYVTDKGHVRYMYHITPIAAELVDVGGPDRDAERREMLQKANKVTKFTLPGVPAGGNRTVGQIRGANTLVFHSEFDALRALESSRKRQGGYHGSNHQNRRSHSVWRLAVPGSVPCCGGRECGFGCIRSEC